MRGNGRVLFQVEWHGNCAIFGVFGLIPRRKLHGIHLRDFADRFVKLHGFRRLCFFLPVSPVFCGERGVGETLIGFGPCQPTSHRDLVCFYCDKPEELICKTSKEIFERVLRRWLRGTRYDGIGTRRSRLISPIAKTGPNPREC